MNTISSRNIESFKNHLLQFLNSNDSGDIYEHFYSQQIRPSRFFVTSNNCSTRFGTIKYRTEPYKEIRKMSNMRIHKSEYFTGIINLLSLYNHYAITYNIVKPKYLLINDNELSGTDHLPLDTQRMFICFTSMFHPIMEYYCEYHTWDTRIIIEL